MMRFAVLAILVLACSKTSPSSSATGSGSGTTTGVAPVKNGVAIPADRPQGPIQITHHCHRSPHPPDTWFYSKSTVYDLDAGTWTSTQLEGNETPPGPPGPDGEQPRPQPKTTSGKLDATQVVTLRKGLAAVLAGGPYEPRYPPSGGGRCTLMLHAKDAEPFFEIDRADQEPNDAVTRLMAAL